jgi:hypothetical protein
LPPAAVVQGSRPHLGQVNWATTNHLRGCNSYQGMKNFSSNSLLSPSPPAILTITEYYFRAQSCGSVVAKFLSPATRGTVLSRGHEAVPWPFRARHDNLPSPYWGEHRSLSSLTALPLVSGASMRQELVTTC